MKYILSLFCVLSAVCVSAQTWEESTAPSGIEQIAVNGNRIWLIGSSQQHGRGLYRRKGNWEFLKGIEPAKVALSKTQAAIVSKDKIAWHYTGEQWIKLDNMNESSEVAFQQETLWIIDNNDCYQRKAGEWTQDQPFDGAIQVLAGGESHADMAFIDQEKGNVWAYRKKKATSLDLTASSVALDAGAVWAVDDKKALKVYKGGNWEEVALGTTAKQVALSTVDGKSKVWVLTSEGKIFSKPSSESEWMAVLISMEEKVVAATSAEINDKDKEGNTPLLRAIRDKKTADAIKMMDEMGADVNIVNKDRETSLMLAVKTKNADLTGKLIEKGVDMNLSNKEGMTALLLAVDSKQEDLAGKLIEAGASLNETNKEGETALMLATNTKQEALAKQLLEAGADVNIDNKKGETALMLAIGTQQMELAKQIAEKGAALDELNKEKKSALSIATFVADQDMVKFLLEKGADVSKGDPLVVAVSNDDSLMVNVLLDAQADPSSALEEAANTDNTRLFKRLTDVGGEIKNNDPLETAIGKGNVEIAEMAVKHGGNVNKGLEWAINADNKAIVMVCLNNAAKANPVLPYAVSKNDKPLFTEAITKYEASAQKGLDAAMAANSIPFGEIAIANGADPNRPLKDMVEAENGGNVEFLLKSGADATKALGYAVDADKVSMAEIAFKYNAEISSNFLLDTSVKNKNLALATLLVEKGADPNKSLMLAVKTAQKDIVKMLLDKGADATSKKLIQEACEQGNVDIAQLLLQKGASANEGMKPAVKNNHTQVVELLLVSGAQAVDPYYIETAASAGNMDMAQMLLDKKANPDAGMPNAIGNGHTEMVEMFISAGASAVKDSYMVTAVSKDYYKIAKVLANNKCPMTFVNSKGQSLLHIASINGSAAVAGLLIENQLDVNRKDADGNTPLHFAVQNKDAVELVQLLAQSGADVNAKNNKGTLVYKEAKGGDIKRYLKSVGAEKK